MAVRFSFSAPHAHTHGKRGNGPGKQDSAQSRCRNNCLFLTPFYCLLTSDGWRGKMDDRAGESLIHSCPLVLLCSYQATETPVEPWPGILPRRTPFSGERHRQDKPDWEDINPCPARPARHCTAHTLIMQGAMSPSCHLLRDRGRLHEA
jgi:hypothetical protein